MKKSFALLVGLLLPLSGLATPGQVPDGKGENGAPKATIVLHERHGHVTPHRSGCQHTGAGNIDVAQPAPDTVVITMSGAAVAGCHPCKDSLASQDFDLVQGLEIALNGAKAEKVKLVVETRVIGLLRTHRCGHATAEEAGGASISAGPTEIIGVQAPTHAVSAGENLSINDHDGPCTAVIAPGKYQLHQWFRVAVNQAHCLLPCKAASAEFAPDPALDQLWISYWEPFHGANKKDFGFQVTVRVAP